MIVQLLFTEGSFGLLVCMFIDQINKFTNKHEIHYKKRWKRQQKQPSKLIYPIFLQIYEIRGSKQNLTDNKNNDMICNYCEHSPSKLHHHYNIQQVKQRFNPTYSHAHIFNSNGSGPAPVRCTPTFHSTAFDVEGYRPVTNQHLKRGAEQQKNKTVNYKNVSLERKQEELNPDTRVFDLKLRNQWYDPAKQELFNSLHGYTQRYSRERKLADLSSNPVFGGPTFEVVPRLSIVSTKQQQLEPKGGERSQQNQEIVHEQAQQNVKLQQESKKTQIIEDKEAKKQENNNGETNSVVNPLSKQQNHQFSIKNEITFGKKGKVGQKLNKNSTIQAQKPAFTIIKSHRN